MNFSKTDLPHLKWSLLAFMLSLLIGGGAVWLSARYLEHAHKERQQAQRQLIDARKKLGDAQNDLQNISVYSREYAVLLNHKIIGGEQRLDWMEELATLHQQHRVADFKYTIAPQQPYLPNPALDTGNYELKLSGLNLQIDLLHEMQLINFFDALRSNAKGWFIIDHCAVERSDANNSTAVSPPDHITAQLKAECTGGWITMQKKGTP